MAQEGKVVCVLLDFFSLLLLSLPQYSPASIYKSVNVTKCCSLQLD